MSSGDHHAVVVGAGIGGLAAAISLRQAGMSVTVLEQAVELRPLGAGLSIWPNGVHALRALGLGAIADTALRDRGGLRRPDGSLIAEFDPNAIAERYDAPLIGMHRASLHEALLEALDPGTLRLGVRVDGIEEAGGLRLADGSAISADLVVGADGLRSCLREELVGDGPPCDSGIVAYRGVAAATSSMPAGEWWGEASVAGLLPLSDGRAYWYVAYRGAPDRDRLTAIVAGYAEPLPEIVAATPQDAVLEHRLFDRDPVERWGDARATLLGDAAHPMLPFLGQGACAALEDAVVIGEAVSESARIEQAIASYERRRLKRTATLVRRSRAAARVALIGSRRGRDLRNAVLGRLPESLRLRQLDAVIKA